MTLTDQWRLVCAFYVFGTPKAQPRARAFARKFGNVYSARVYDPGTAEGWKGAIAMEARAHKPRTPIESAVRIDVAFLFPRPKRLEKKSSPAGRIRHDVKPDRDNCEKAVTDCLKTLGFLKDDCQVCDGVVQKFYVAKGESPGAEITISVPSDLPAEPVAAGGLF